VNSKNEPARKVNALGLLCPLPVYRTAAAIRAVHEGEVVEILADDRPFEVDLREWCEETGHELLDIVDLGGRWRARVRKSARASGV
jgi:tRNA 2-thiouridine synthesizing protein A